MWAKEGNPVSGVNSLFSPPPVSFPHLLYCSLFCHKFPPLVKSHLFLACWCPFLSPPLSQPPLFLIYSTCFNSIPTSPICPTCLCRPPPHPLHTTPIPPMHPLHPHMNGYKSEGKFIRSKNKHVSVSVLLPCRVPQGCTVLWMGPVCSPRLGSARTLATHTTERTHFPKDTQQQLSLLFTSFVIAVICPQANLALVLSCGFTAVRMGLRTQEQ